MPKILNDLEKVINSSLATTIKRSEINFDQLYIDIEIEDIISTILFITLLLQIFLGILTILSGAQIILASLHQIGSIFLVTASLILVFKNSKIN